MRCWCRVENVFAEATVEAVGDVGVVVENVFVEATIKAVKDVGVGVDNVYEKATVEVVEDVVESESHLDKEFDEGLVDV